MISFHRTSRTIVPPCRGKIFIFVHVYLVLVLVLTTIPCSSAHSSSSSQQQQQQLSSFFSNKTPPVLPKNAQTDEPQQPNTITIHATAATTTTPHNFKSVLHKDMTQPPRIHLDDSNSYTLPPPPTTTTNRQLGGGHQDFQDMDIIEFVSTLVDTPMDEWSAIQVVVFLALLMLLGALTLCCCCSCLCRPMFRGGGCCGRGGGSCGCQDLLMCFCCYELCCRDGQDLDVCCGGAAAAPYNLV